MELFEESGPEPLGGNAPPLTVSEISGAVKRVLEGEFGRVRVRGEIGRISRPSSGHLYFDLKDDRAVLAAICWRDQACRLPHRPEEGMEVIVTGRLTTFPGQSKYQLVVGSVEPAGLGAMMAMLDQRRKTLAAEGLFDPGRKRPIPYLPGVIAVVTSPSGAVIRDILHRLRDRFPTHVLIWPVAVQGAQCAPQVANAIARLNGLVPGGPVPRPDLIIVARGGGSVEDLWGFNDETVVRAVAASTIPLISAVGHETDTTLIDHAADLRAPTPTAAAEMAVPVLAELGARLADTQTRLWRCARARIDHPAQRLGDLGRAMGRPQALTDPARQRLDLVGPRLEPVLSGFVRDRRRRSDALILPLFALRRFMSDRKARFARLGDDLASAFARGNTRRESRLPRLSVAALRYVPTGARRRLDALGPRLTPTMRRRGDHLRQRITELGGRVGAAHVRLRLDAQRKNDEARNRLIPAGRRLDALGPRLVAERRLAVEALDRLRQTLGHTETLRRGFAIVRGPDGLVTSAPVAARQSHLEIQFHDGRVRARPDHDGGPAQSAASSPGLPSAGSPSAAEPLSPSSPAAPSPTQSAPSPRRKGRRSDTAHDKGSSSKGGQGSLF